MALNDKQLAFAREYLVDRNGTQAAIRAGYSKKTARSIGTELLAKPAVRKIIDEGTKKQIVKSDLTADRVLLELQRIAFNDIGQIFDESGQLLPLSKMPEDARRVIAGLETQELFVMAKGKKIKRGYLRKVKTSDKVRALETLAKYFKLLTDNIHHTGKVTTEVTNADIERERAEIQRHKDVLKGLGSVVSIESIDHSAPKSSNDVMGSASLDERNPSGSKS